MFDLKIVFKK